MGCILLMKIKKEQGPYHTGDVLFGVWVEVEKANETLKAKTAINEALPGRRCLWEAGLLRKSGRKEVVF